MRSSLTLFVVLALAACGRRAECPKCVSPAPVPAPSPAPVPPSPPVPPAPPEPPSPAVVPPPPAGLLSVDQVVAAFLSMGTNEPMELPGLEADWRFQAVRNAGQVAGHLRPVQTSGRHTGLPASGLTSLDLRGWDTDIRNQGQRGTCTAFGTIAAIENVAKHKLGKDYDLSEEMLWDCYRRPYVEGAIGCAQKLFVVPESLYPYNPRHAYHRSVDPSLGVVNEPGFTQIQPTLGAIIQSVIEDKVPSVFALDVSRSWMNSGSSGAINPFDRSVVGGHAIAIVGVIQDARLNADFGGGYFIVKNSWGPENGDHGYNYVPFAYCQTHQCYEAFEPSLDALVAK